MCEALYLFGCMLLTLEERIPGDVRECIAISYKRYKGELRVEETWTDVARVCHRTEYVKGRPVPEGYPESYFERFDFPRAMVDAITTRLRSDDLCALAS